MDHSINLKYGTKKNPPTRQKQTHRQENRLVVVAGEASKKRDGMRVWGWQMQTITFRMHKQQGFGVHHRELY